MNASREMLSSLRPGKPHSLRVMCEAKEEGLYGSPTLFMLLDAFGYSADHAFASSCDETVVLISIVVKSLKLHYGQKVQNVFVVKFP